MPPGFTSKALALLLAAAPLLSCDEGLRLVVVEQGGSGGALVAPQAGTGASAAGGGGGGTATVIPTAGTPSEGGSSVVEPGGGGASGSPDDSGGAAGAPTPPVEVWDAEPRYTASFVSHAFPGQYVRYIDDKGFIGALDLQSAADREQASFEMIPGLYDQNCSSFRALNKPATLFRHANSRIFMQPADSLPLYLADATFCEEPGMADAVGITFRSVNYVQRVIHLRNQNELWIDDVPDPMTPEFASEATFYRQTALSESL